MTHMRSLGSLSVVERSGRMLLSEKVVTRKEVGADARVVVVVDEGRVGARAANGKLQGDVSYGF